MRRLIFTVRQCLSSKRFYETLNEQMDKLLPNTPEQFIISKYLNEGKKLIKHDYETSAKKKQQDFVPQKSHANYREFFKSNPYGSIIEKEYKNVHVSYVSLSNNRIYLSQLYKVCDQFKPDLLLLQARPELYNLNFELLPKIDNAFSDIKYLEQLLIKPAAINSAVLSTPIQQKLQAIVLNQQNDKECGQKVFIENNNGIVDDSIILMASYYAMKNQSDIIFGQMPHQVYRQWICNSHTLMELQELFNNICKNIPFYNSLELTPYKLGILLYPEIFLNLNDRYMSTLLEMVIANNQHKKIMAIVGVMENQAVDQILEAQMNVRLNSNAKEQHTPIIQYLIPPTIKSSVFRNIEGWQIIQKHILFDILYNGKQAAFISMKKLKVTNQMIAHYGQNIYGYSQKALMNFRYDMTFKYLKIMKKKIEEGNQLKKKFIMREAIRSNHDTQQ